MATETVTLRVEGMGCEGCVAAVQEALSGVPGVRRVMVTLEQGLAEVEAEAPADPKAMIAAIDRAGYDATAA
ncbi:MAG: heavy metal-associated domain-containing protein [Geminicoccaceae bacterium]